MLRIAMVEDDEAETERLCGYLDRYAQEKGDLFKYDRYENAFLFMEGYRQQYDIVFMDIQMPQINGMDAAKWLRSVDHAVVLIFVTNLAQYAVRSYEVEALDYILKPVTYAAFVLKMQRAVGYCRRENSPEVIIRTADGMVRVRANEVKYIEVFEHHLRYRTENGDVYSYGTLKQLEESLPGNDFCRCNNQTIVNLRFVERCENGQVWVDQRAFEISRKRRKGFLEALHLYYIPK